MTYTATDPHAATTELLLSESTEQWWDDAEFWQCVRQFAMDRLLEIEDEELN